MTIPTSNRFDSVASAGASTGGSGLVPVVTIRGPAPSDIRGPNGPFRLGQVWIDNTANSSYTLTSYSSSNGQVSANWEVSGASSTLATLTGDTGGALTPNAGNINILGGALDSFVGSGSTLTLTPKPNGFPITPFVVAPAGQGGYQTVQSAINAAHAAGGGTVYISGTYTENLTLYTGVALAGVEANVDNRHAVIIGTHTPPIDNGVLSFYNINFEGVSSIFFSAAAGQAYMVFNTCTWLLSTAGYIFDMLNWVGPTGLPSGSAGLAVNNCGDHSSVHSGFLRNTASMDVALLFSSIGGYDKIAGGAGLPLILTGDIHVSEADFYCPIQISGSSTAIIFESSVFHGFGITASGSTSGKIINSSFIGLAVAALVMSSSAAWTLSTLSIDSSNNPAIDGAGAGLLTLGGISFLNNYLLAGTLTTAAAMIRGGSFISQYVVGPSPDAKFQTVQSALDAAHAAGGGTVFVSGTYTENLTLYTGVALAGIEANVDNRHAVIIGTHTPPVDNGVLTFFNINFEGVSSIFSSAAAGQAYMVFNTCTWNLSTAGYIFDMLNWVGPSGLPSGSAGLAVNNCGDHSSVHSGFLRNTAHMDVALLFSSIGGYDKIAGGSGLPLILSGAVHTSQADFYCPIQISGSSIAIIFEASVFHGFGITASGSTSGTVINSSFIALAVAAFVMSSSAAWTLSSVTIDTTNNPAIDGAGTGVFSYGSTSYASNDVIAGTLTTVGFPVRAGSFIASSSITASNGNITLGTAGNKIISTSVGTTTAAGANSFGSVTLVGGTATVATTAVTASSLIFLSRQSIGATGAAALGQLSVGTISAGTSFVINAALTSTATSLATTDVSVVSYMIVN